MARLTTEVDRRCDDIAVETGDQTCIVPPCNVRRNTQIDHRNNFGRTRVTRREDHALLCRWHHGVKTFLGYTDSGGPGTWRWIPPESRDEDVSEMRKIITCARCWGASVRLVHVVAASRGPRPR